MTLDFVGNFNYYSVPYRDPLEDFNHAIAAGVEAAFPGASFVCYEHDNGAITAEVFTDQEIGEAEFVVDLNGLKRSVGRNSDPDDWDRLASTGSSMFM